ncbi:MAG: hypothetical protein ACE5JG_10555, partial [Planctomycetota bacterium]
GRVGEPRVLRRRLSRLLPAAVAGLAAACGGDPGGLPVGDVAGRIYGTGAVAVGGRTPIDPATVGTIRGRAVYTLEAPDFGREDISEKYCRDLHGSAGLRKNDLVVGKDGGLRWVFVYVKQGLEAYERPPAPAGRS